MCESACAAAPGPGQFRAAIEATTEWLFITLCDVSSPRWMRIVRVFTRARARVVLTGSAPLKALPDVFLQRAFVPYSLVWPVRWAAQSAWNRSLAVIEFV